MTDKNTKKIFLDSESSFNAKVIKLAAFNNQKIAKLFYALIWLLGTFSILLAALLISQRQTNLGLLKLSLFFSLVFAYYLWFRSYYFNKLQKSPNSFTPKEAKILIAENKALNLFSIFSFDLSVATFSICKGDLDPDARTFFKEALKSRETNFILNRISIGRETISDFAAKASYQNSLEDLLVKALDLAEKQKHQAISGADILSVLFKFEPEFQSALKSLKLTQKDVESITLWNDKLLISHENDGNFFNPDRIKLNGGIGRDWAYGYANIIRYYADDLTRWMERNYNHVDVVGRESEIRQIEDGLLGTANGNVILVGDEGVGKTTIVMGFAKKVIEGKVNESLGRIHIFRIDIDEILSDSRDSGELVASLKSFLDEAQNIGNALVLIENIERFLSTLDASSVDITSLLESYLSSPNLSIIATCDRQSYEDIISRNGSLASKFIKIDVKEPNKEELMQILQDVVPSIEMKTQSMVSFEALKATLELSHKYIVNLPDPEKSINLLESAAVKAVGERGETIILGKDIESYLSQKLDIPLGAVSNIEKEKLLNLEAIMHGNLIGQDHAVSALANALRRARANISTTSKPIGSFLFLGPTGVGKTQAARSLAAAYFGGENSMIRFDMSEYQNEADLYRLIGDESSSGMLVNAVSEKPFSLLLFDEIEKANPKLLNLLLQILDEGYMTNFDGKKTIFTNNIIIATSNAGSDLIHESIKDGINYEEVRSKLADYLIEQGIFSPELLNRFTELIAFSPLTTSELTQIAKIKLDQLADHLNEEQNIKLIIDEDVIEKIIEIGYSPEMGARPMERAIQEKIENIIAEKSLKGEIKDNVIEITKEMIG